MPWGPGRESWNCPPKLSSHTPSLLCLVLQRADADERKKTTGSMMGEALKKGHNLLSIITVEPGDDFTRPQRLAVLLNIVLGQIAGMCMPHQYFSRGTAT
jgi:hypothetical protein